jgi:hypothetical protein
MCLGRTQVSVALRRTFRKEEVAGIALGPTTIACRRSRFLGVADERAGDQLLSA